MKQISNQEYEKYQQYQTDKLHDRILTPGYCLEYEHLRNELKCDTKKHSALLPSASADGNFFAFFSNWSRYPLIFLRLPSPQQLLQGVRVQNLNRRRRIPEQPPLFQSFELPVQGRTGDIHQHRPF